MRIRETAKYKAGDLVNHHGETVQLMEVLHDALEPSRVVY